jgi:hypothetical protein
VLFVSGDSDEAAFGGTGSLVANSTLLRQPFRISELAAKSVNGRIGGKAWLDIYLDLTWTSSFSIPFTKFELT